MTRDTEPGLAGTASPPPSPARPAEMLRAVEAEPASHTPSSYVDRSGVSLQHFTNRYIRTRHRPVNDANRSIVRKAVASYRGGFPAPAAELEAFLDGVLNVSDGP